MLPVDEKWKYRLSNMGRLKKTEGWGFSVRLTEDRIQIEGAIIVLRYSYDLIESSELNANVPISSNTVLYTDGDTEYAICLLEYYGNRQAHWIALFAAEVATRPLVKIIDNLMLIKFGFRIHALDTETGERVWVYESRYPVLFIYEHLSYIAFVSEVEVGLLDSSGECVWRYAHRELIIEADAQQDGIRFKDFDQKRWFIGWSNGMAHLIE